MPNTLQLTETLRILFFTYHFLLFKPIQRFRKSGHILDTQATYDKRICFNDYLFRVLFS